MNIYLFLQNKIIIMKKRIKGWYTWGNSTGNIEQHIMTLFVCNNHRETYKLRWNYLLILGGINWNENFTNTREKNFKSNMILV